MKTSNKTNSRIIVFASVLMVMSLVSVNLNAQKSYRNYTLASLGNSLIANTRIELIEKFSMFVSNTPVKDSNPLEDWMLNPSSWNNKYNLIIAGGENVEEKEMILEDWMMKANWEDNTKAEDELGIEEWMCNAESWNN